MNTDPKPPYQPGLLVRLLIWFGIYFAAQLPLIPYHADYVWYPFGLVMPFVMLADKLTHSEIHLPALTLNILYVFYAAHLAASLIVRPRRTYYILIWILVFLVIFNLAGCELVQHTH